MAHTPTINETATQLNATIDELARVTAQAQVCVQRLQFLTADYIPRIQQIEADTRARLQDLEAEERRLVIRADFLATIQEGSGPAANTRAQTRRRVVELYNQQLVEDMHAL